MYLYITMAVLILFYWFCEQALVGDLLFRVEVSEARDTLALLLEESGTIFNLVQFFGT